MCDTQSSPPSSTTPLSKIVPSSGRAIVRDGVLIFTSLRASVNSKQTKCGLRLQKSHLITDYSQILMVILQQGLTAMVDEQLAQPHRNRARAIQSHCNGWHWAADLAGVSPRFNLNITAYKELRIRLKRNTTFWHHVEIDLAKHRNGETRECDSVKSSKFLLIRVIQTLNLVGALSSIFPHKRITFHRCKRKTW